MPTTNDKVKRCASQHFGAWAIEPQWWQQAFAAVKAGTWKAMDWDDECEEETPADLRGYEIIENIAVIRIQGQMAKGRSSFGGCCTTDVRRAVRNAANDSQVRGIMMVIDSPGGTVAGTEDLARDVADAGKLKPLFTYCQDMACSAGYWVASQGRRVYANATSLIGCIGTYTVLEDSTGAQDLMGVKFKVISTGRFKGLGADGKVTDDLVTDVQREVNELNGPFLAAVMAGRGRDEEWVQTVSDGRAYAGAQALSLGLIDEVASLDAAMKALQAEVIRQQTERNSMDRADFIKFAAENPDVLAEVAKPLTQAAKTDGYAEGGRDATNRLNAINAAIPGRPAFAIEQFVEGHDVGVAKANLADVLLKELAAAKQNPPKSQEPEQTGVPFDASTANDAAADKARADELLASSSAGRAVLAERNARR